MGGDDRPGVAGGSRAAGDFMTDPTQPFDLRNLAREAMVEAGFDPDFPPDVTREVAALPGPAPAGALQDLRGLLWSSVDNETSRDLDQVEVAEALPEGDIRLRVGIADVDAFAPERSATDDHAERNTTSVYTGVETFP